MKGGVDGDSDGGVVRAENLNSPGRQRQQCLFVGGMVVFTLARSLKLSNYHSLINKKE